MSAKKVIVVTGATGAQGGSVVKFLLDEGTFAVRAITRNPDSEKAKSLAAKGAEVVKADLFEFEAIKKAFDGAYGVFAVTNFWDPSVGEAGEIKQGKYLVDAAKATDIKHFIWSTLDHTEWKPSHWESKADVDDYLKESGVPRTSLYTTFYFENFLSGFFPLKKEEDGSCSLFLPMITDVPTSIYAAADTGAYALEIFKHPSKWLGKDFRAATEFISPREMADALTSAIGKKVVISEIDKAGFDALKGGSIPEEFLANNLALQGNPAPPFRDPELCRRVYPGIKTFKEWALENKDKLLK